LRVGRPGAYRGRNLLPAEVDDGRGATPVLRGCLRRGRGEQLLLRHSGYPEHGAVGRADAAGLPVPRQGVLAADGPSPAAGDPAGGADGAAAATPSANTPR